ncbi:DUF937 domain-containing protein [Sphingorhabdus sp. Alg239-R122]|uniref:DUF937 domain-containing protein n=1 Tax=Sphingorhabdus sp. Alg239-R122 TaxID=2305989 RepID=UPI0013DB7769|nr:DUF937 domain-containing protein [Sphingorhabdus sp. Alg239-R122]
MNIMEVLQQTGGLESLANDLGIDKNMAQTGAAALLPAILGGFKKQTQAQPGGIEDLVGMIGGLGGTGLLENVLGKQPTNVSKGNEILGQIFGSKDVSRTVAGSAAQQTGLDTSILKKMLPILSMLVAGYMANQAGGNRGAGQTAGGGALGGILGNVLGGVLGGNKSQGGVLGGLGSMLDLDGDGNPLDDIIGMASKFNR